MNQAILGSGAKKPEEAADEVAAKAIAEILSHRFDCTNESCLQLGLEFVLRPLGFRSEVSIGSRGRLDFFHESGVAVEAKADGSLNALRRQCERYLAEPGVRRVIVASAKAYHVGAKRDRVDVVLVGGAF